MPPATAPGKKQDALLAALCWSGSVSRIESQLIWSQNAAKQFTRVNKSLPTSSVVTADAILALHLRSRFAVQQAFDLSKVRP